MKTSLIKLGLGILTCLFYLLIIEIGMQAYRFVVNLSFEDSNAEAFLHEYDPVKGWKNKALATDNFILREDRVKLKVHINSKGLRGPEYDYPKPEGMKRVLLLGDSIVAGFEVNESETVAGVLERLLSTHGEWQVLNGGVRGYGTDQSYLFFLEEGKRYQPDIVVYFFVQNDIKDNLKTHEQGRKYGKSYFEIDQNGELQLRGVPVPEYFNPSDRTQMGHPIAQKYFESIENPHALGTLGSAPKNAPLKWASNMKRFLYEHSLLYQFTSQTLKRWQPFRESFFRFGLIRFKDSPILPDDVLNEGWELTKRIMLAMKELSDSSGSKFLIFEVLSSAPEARPSQQLDGFSKNADIPLIQSYRAFSDAAAKGTSLRRKDKIHWNSNGHALAAQLIYTFLSQEKWISSTKKNVS